MGMTWTAATAAMGKRPLWRNSVFFERTRYDTTLNEIKKQPRIARMTRIETGGLLFF
jgi:hypothetical protein